MALKKQNKTKKQEVKELIQMADFLSNKEMVEWIALVDVVSVSKLKDIGNYFEKLLSERDVFIMEQLYKYKLGSEYKQKIKDISQKYEKESRKKEEKFIIVQENPEEILKKLQDIDET